MIKMFEERKKEFIIDLMNEEYNRRIEVISKTGKLEPDDIITIATLTLNYEMGELVQEMGEFRTGMARDLGELRKEMLTKKTLAWGLGIYVIVQVVVQVIIEFLIP